MTTSPIQPGEETVAAARPRPMLQLDPLLILAAVGLVACSLVTLKGATEAQFGMHYVYRQALYAGIGVLVMLAFCRFDYSRLREYKYGFFALMVALNLVVYAMPPIQNARRWIPTPFVQFQSSEFGKVLVIVSLAAFAVDRARRLHEFRTTARVMLLALIAAMLVIPQPDLGTGLVYVAVGFTILFFVGTPWKHLLGLVAMFVASIAIVLAGAPALGVHVLKGYQKQRLTTFINPPKNCTLNDTTCYQLQQSEIAIGSGGKLGRGAANATETRLHFLPTPDTDFVFAAVGEAYGFVGAAVVLSLYALLIWRTLRILTMSKNLFGTAVAGGILAMFMFQVFLNVGMTIGIMPVAGVPLPLLSYGGSSVIVTFIALTLLQSIRVQARIAAKSRGFVS